MHNYVNMRIAITETKSWFMFRLIACISLLMNLSIFVWLCLNNQYKYVATSIDVKVINLNLVKAIFIFQSREKWPHFI